jgi:hypothetical protein
VGLGLALVVGEALVGRLVLGGVVVRGATVVVRGAGLVGGRVVRGAAVGVTEAFTGAGTTEKVIVGLAFVALGPALGAAAVVGASVVRASVVRASVVGVMLIVGASAAADAEATGAGLTDPPERPSADEVCEAAEAL